MIALPNLILGSVSEHFVHNDHQAKDHGSINLRSYIDNVPTTPGSAR